jgi:hypothetical protein
MLSSMNMTAPEHYPPGVAAIIFHPSGYANTTEFVGSEILIAVVMKSCTFWDISPCSLVKATDVSDADIPSVNRIIAAFFMFF